MSPDPLTGLVIVREAGLTLVWANEAAEAWRRWDLAMSDDPDIPPEPPKPSVALDRAQANELVVSLLRGPMGPVGPIGMMGPKGADA